MKKPVRVQALAFRMKQARDACGSRKLRENSAHTELAESPVFNDLRAKFVVASVLLDKTRSWLDSAR